MSLSSSPAECLAAYLVAQGVLTRPATAGAWPVTTTTMPDEGPDNRVSIMNPDAENQGKNPRTGEQYTSDICQIRVRSVPASVGMAKMKEILARLAPIIATAVTTNVPESVIIVSVTLVSGPAYMGQDEKNTRQNHVMNVKVPIVSGA